MATKHAPQQLQRGSFKKILELEQEKGFEDTAIIGGMDRFLKRHMPDLVSKLETPAKRLLTASYTGMVVSQRREWVRSMLDAMGSGEEAALADKALGSGRSGTQPARADRLAKGSPSTVKATDHPVDTATAPRSSRKPAPGPKGTDLDSPVDSLKGVDTKTSARLRRLGVETVRDLLYLFPRRHRDLSKVTTISELVPGQEQTILATVWEARPVTLGRKLRATEAVVSDETGNIRVLWFGRNYLAKMLRPGVRVAISGRMEVYRGRPQLESPEFEVLDGGDELVHTGRLVPVYPLTEGLAGRRMRSFAWQALERWGPYVEEHLPEDLRSRTGLIGLQEAIKQAHYPDDWIRLEDARRRLAFDEFFLIQMAMQARRKSRWDGVQGFAVGGGEKVVDGFRSCLPFAFTAAQERCLGEILNDMKTGTPPMNRLLQGEVGSGKTVVVLAALLAAVASGYQGSIMVPTEVLAEQHFATVSILMGDADRPLEQDGLVTVYLESYPRSISVGLLTGSTRPAVKKDLRRRMSEGELDIVIGTHALIQEGVEMPRLALAAVDEQHRFGVLQRAALRQSGGPVPHVLVMSATPIPRTLALTLYGDLDISTIDEIPPGRQRVVTRHISPQQRGAAYGFVRKEVAAGRQAFVVCPLIEESEAVEARAATEEYRRLSTEVFPDLRLGLLHGRMPVGDKDDVMRRFRDGHLDILVSTPVVEVGIDVPNATVMLVEGAHRFGLAQLHQFRGRVGRGSHKSYCILLSDQATGEAKPRLSALERIHDGFRLAEVDLELRGPGDIFGTRQSGLPSLRMARLSDQDLLTLAKVEAERVMREAPELLEDDASPLAREVGRFFERVQDEVS